MKNVLTALAVFSLLFFGSCVGLEYPDYWNFDHSAVRNVVTLPFEIIFTPIIFLLKFLPIL